MMMRRSVIDTGDDDYAHCLTFIFKHGMVTSFPKYFPKYIIIAVFKILEKLSQIQTNITGHIHLKGHQKCELSSL